MKQPDPSRFTGKKEPKADELEMKGFSSSLPVEPENHTNEAEAKPEPVIETEQPRDQATKVSRHHDTSIEEIRKAVKIFGKEAATHRFTQEEKQKIAELIFAYSSQGIRTSENEIARIAVNFLVQDYKNNKKHSILDKVLRLLNS
jgi:hypothetical protein